MAGLVAMYLLARGRAESWAWWIAVDLVGVLLYRVKGVRFIAPRYVVLLGMAAYGWWRWTRRSA